MITNDIKYIGVNDHQIDLFEGQYNVPNGMSYNSYIILDEKIAIMDSVDARFESEWLKNLRCALAGRKPDYLIVQHMEPDHSANIMNFLEAYPDATVVGNARTFEMIDRFFGSGICMKKLVVKDGSELSLGKHKLRFILAAMVHWPEVMVTYDSEDKVLFTADAFGKFGALDVEEEWECEARRYYFGIVGKYGMQVQQLLETVKTLEVQKICPLHGPVLEENLDHYIGLYNTWSNYDPESEGVFIAYVSPYGHTREAVQLLARRLGDRGCKNVITADLSRTDLSECIEDAFRYDRLVLASTTYNGDVFPAMKTFINSLLERGYKKRKIGLIENGSWGATAARIMRKLLEGNRGITFAEPTVSIKSALNDESSAAICRLAEDLEKEKLKK